MPLNNPPIIIKKDGYIQGSVNTLDFSGNVTVNGNSVTISASGGTASAKQIEIDFGVKPISSKTFTIIDSNISANSYLIATQSGIAATGRSADENEMDPMIFSAIPSSGRFILIANTINGPVVGKYKVNYIIG